MLFYAALTVAGVVSAALIVWLFRSFMMAGQSAFSTVSGTRHARPRTARLASNVGGVKSPWGWGSPGTTPNRRVGSQTRVGGASVLGGHARPNGSNPGNTLGNTLGKHHTASDHAGSVRNVLTGYDMQREKKTDTSSWPYQDSIKSGGSAIPRDKPTLTEPRKRPKKPWGW